MPDIDPLKNVLAELKKAGALAPPEQSVIKAAPFKTQWLGKKRDGSMWKLIKNNATSYSCSC